jgi:predicted SprT family Zn-dependent metalloprotease
MNLQEMKKACEDRIQECLDIARRHGTDLPIIPIIWSTKMHQTGGIFGFRRMRVSGDRYIEPRYIKLSVPIMVNNFEEFLKDVPGHEVAHYIATMKHNDDCNHDYRWQNVMRMIGQPANRTHQMETINTRRLYKCKCSCSIHHVTKQKFEKILLGGYKCRQCKTAVIAVGKCQERIKENEDKKAALRAHINQKPVHIPKVQTKNGMSISDQVRELLRGLEHGFSFDMLVQMVMKRTGLDASKAKQRLKYHIPEVGYVVSKS